MNIDAFVTIFKGENYDEEMFYDLSINGLVQIRENVWEHEKTREKYVFTISPFGYVTRVEKLTGNELIKLPNSNMEGSEEEEEKVTKSRIKYKTDFYRVLSLYIEEKLIGPGAFFNAIEKMRKRNPELYQGFVDSLGITINNKKWFNWFVENCPKDKNGQFSKLTRYSGKQITLDQASQMLSGNDGHYYYLKAYDLAKTHEIEFFISLLNNIVKYIKVFK